MYQEIILKFPTSIAAGCMADSSEIKQYIVEGEDKRCHTHYDSEGTYHFEVSNPKAQLLHFVAIDHCLFSAKLYNKRCDCAIFNHDTFCFIEIKRKKGKIGALRREAKEQLRQTIFDFKKEFPKIENFNIEAYASIGKGIVSPSFRASFQNASIEFEKETGAVLLIADEKEF